MIITRHYSQKRQSTVGGRGDHASSTTARAELLGRRRWFSKPFAYSWWRVGMVSIYTESRGHIQSLTLYGVQRRFASAAGWSLYEKQRLVERMLGQ